MKGHTFRIGEEMVKKGFSERDAADYNFLHGEKLSPMTLKKLKMEMKLY